MVIQDYVIGNAKDVKNIVGNKNTAPPQLIISSPPYFDLLNYNNNRKQLGFGQKSYNDYLEEICKVFQDCYDVSTPDATFWLVVDTFKKNKEVKLFPFDIANKLKEKGNSSWLLRDIIIWDKGKNLPWNNKGNFKNQHEYILFFTKSDNFKFHVDRVREILDLKKWWKTYPERYNPDGRAPSNIWCFNTPIRGWGDSKQNHMCPFPFPLVEKIISLSTDEGDWVLDPFVGSGSVLAIAMQMGRNSVGIDVNEEYKKRYKEEVYFGAERYWRIREKELEEGKKLFAEFKQTNNKLRKLKVASNICEHLSRVNKYPFVYYTRDKPKNAIEIIILQNGQVPIINMENKDLDALIKQSKIDTKVSIEKDLDFAVRMKDKKIFKYKMDKFFCYTTSCKMKTVLQNESKYEFMYSDIEIKISKN